jgi:hypothetical protein
VAGTLDRVPMSRFVISSVEPPDIADAPAKDTRNIKIMFPGSKVRRVRKADNLTATSEPIV